MKWGQRKLTDDVIRQIVAQSKVMPRCEKTYRELAKRYHCGCSTVAKIAGGWVLPRGTNHEKNQ